MSNEYEEFMESNKKEEKDVWGNTPNQISDTEEIIEVETLDVRIVDMHIPFGSLTYLIFKGFFAFILACIFFGLIGLAVTTLITGLFFI